MGVATKRSAMVLMMLVLVLGLVLSGCGKSTDNSASDTTQTTTDNGGSTDKGSSDAQAGATTDAPKPLTISMFIGEPHQQPTADNKIFKMIKDKLGVTLKMEFLVGDVQQKLGVMIAGGDYPDVMTGDDKLISAGAFIPLEDLIDKYAPNLKKHYADVWNQIKDPKTGHIYVLPNYGVYSGTFHDTTYEGPAFWIQKRVMEDAGWPTPKTLDEYFKIIADYHAKHPDTIGFETLNYDWRVFGLQNPPEHLAGHPNDGGVIVNDGKAEIFADKDIAKKYYKKLNEINAQGLFDKESVVQNYDQYMAKISSGKVLGVFDQHWNYGDAERSLISQGKFDETYIPFPLTYDGVKPYYRDRPVVNINRGYGISVNAKDPVAIIKFFDSLMTEDWQKTLQWGIKGEDYMVDDNGMFYRTPEQRKNANDTAWQLANQATQFFGNAPKMEGSYSDGNATGPGTQPQEFYDSLNDYDKKVMQAYGHKTWTDFLNVPPPNPVYYPAWSINLIDGSPAKVAQQKLNDLEVKYLPKLILTDPSNYDTMWNEYVDQIHKVDTNAYINYINEQLKWRIDHWSSNNGSTAK